MTNATRTPTSKCSSLLYKMVHYLHTIYRHLPVYICVCGSSVHGILQARILEWVAVPFSRGSSQSRDQTQVSRIAGRVFNQLSHQGSPRILEWVVYPFSIRSFQPRNRTRVSCIAGRFLTELSGKPCDGGQGVLQGGREANSSFAFWNFLEFFLNVFDLQLLDSPDAEPSDM